MAVVVCERNEDVEGGWRKGEESVDVAIHTASISSVGIVSNAECRMPERS
jgi:hypothetical protein